MILNGMIRITAPSPESSSSAYAAMAAQNGSNISSAEVAYIMPGTLKSSLVIAADIKETSYLTGHYTEFPSNEPTVLVQIPFEGNRVPEHTVLHDGQC
ncbi:uncharacterized protein BCR38DRAFT_440928 [Pseudomassariella vexata]|uniref:Uncharacterized protein n=1 Tax=Pseudomassariella vexata TaxID=1141098 RepID=A0A1Y2DR41_9PEZI|nr:uncharacterized protein BCR38DRAFT_440928 [Pseudomassariella vexata]ORY61707.1 hypothetical protein BCR38DRAFT_440928 [Pseudomassariella vexata]